MVFKMGVTREPEKKVTLSRRSFPSLAALNTTFLNSMLATWNFLHSASCLVNHVGVLGFAVAVTISKCSLPRTPGSPAPIANSQSVPVTHYGIPFPFRAAAIRTPQDLAILLHQRSRRFFQRYQRCTGWASLEARFLERVNSRCRLRTEALKNSGADGGTAESNPNEGSC